MDFLSFSKLSFVSFLLIGSNLVLAQGGGRPVDKATQDVSNQPGVNKDWQRSMTPDGAYDRAEHFNKPIQWQYLREADILYKKRIWREIDTREKQNMPFRFQGDENSGGGMFIEILIDGIKRGKIKAYSTMDDRFTGELKIEQLLEQINGKDDTVYVEDPITNQQVPRITHTDFRPDLITKYRLKEDWYFDRNLGKMVVRILGLAPVRDVVGDDGLVRGQKAMFWLYYPDIREYLARFEVYNPENDIVRATWDEYFEARQFSSRITKVSNPFDQKFEEVFGTDARGKMEQLYESQRTAEQLFNKEHDMWVY